MYGTKLHRASLLIFSFTLIASQWALAQAGHLDPTFGNGGIVTTDFGDQNYTNNMATANAVIIQPNGQIVVGGGIPGNNDFPIPAVARSVLITRGWGWDRSPSALRNSRLAASASRNADSRKSMVAPLESMARYK